MKKLNLFLIIGAVLVIALFIGFRGTGNAVNEEGLIKIPVDSVTEEATFYKEGPVQYFLVLGTDGEIKTALDACDVCGGTKGYRQEGSYMVCNNCGQKFHVNFLGKDNIKGGGCWPSHLDHEVKDGFVIIKKSDIDSNAWRF